MTRHRPSGVSPRHLRTTSSQLHEGAGNDHQAGLAVQVDTLDAAGDRVGLGEAESRTLRTFEEIPDIGAQWTFVAAYGGQEVYREDLAKTELADRNWTITIPPDATDALEQAGFQ